MRLRRKIVVLAVMLLTWAAADARAERIELATGDVLIGKVVSQDDQQVVIEHPVLGRLTLAAANVRAVTPDAPVAADAPAVPAAPPQPADPAVAADAASKAEPAAAAPQPQPPAPAPAAVVAEPQKAAEPFYRQWLKDWKIQLALGGNFRDSEKKTLDVNTRLTGTFADEKDRWKIDLSYFRAAVDERETRNEVRAFVQKDWLLPDSPWFVFGQTQYDYDQYKSWDHRLSMHGGLGYSLKPALGIDVDLRGGAGVTREFGGVDPDTRPESLFGSELAWQINPQHKLAATAQVFPGLDGFTEYRLVTTADWTMKLTEELGLRVGMRDEYDSAEPAGFQANDLRVYGSLVFSF